MVQVPSYDGRGLVNLMAELELRLGGSPPMPSLTGDLAAEIPDADTYVLVLFDGLGDHQLDHPNAGSLREARRAAIDAPFPSTTTVSLATAASGLTPASHGIIGYQMWIPETGGVVNILKWRTPGGEPVEFDYEAVLPKPNLWERLTETGVEPITVQPYNFEGSPLSDMLYRGCRFEPFWSEDEIAEATLQLAGERGRLILTYVPHVDVAAHVTGQQSESYNLAVKLADRIWSGITARLPGHAAVVGTADHGHIDFDADHKVPLTRPDGVAFFGDPRAVYVRGDNTALQSLPGRWLDSDELVELWGGSGGEVHPALQERTPDSCVLSPADLVLLPSSMDDRWIGYHGGLEPGEIEVPLLVAGG